MAFQAPLGQSGASCGRDVGYGQGMTGEIDYSTGRPRISTAPLSGERDVLWNGSSTQTLSTRNADSYGMKSSAFTLSRPDQSVGSDPRNTGWRQPVQLHRLAHRLAKSEGGATSGRRLVTSYEKVNCASSVRRSAQAMRRNHGRWHLGAAGSRTLNRGGTLAYPQQ